jgi:hypothetical protein
MSWSLTTSTGMTNRQPFTMFSRGSLCFRGTKSRNLRRQRSWRWWPVWRSPQHARAKCWLWRSFIGEKGLQTCSQFQVSGTALSQVSNPLVDCSRQRTDENNCVLSSELDVLQNKDPSSQHGGSAALSKSRCNLQTIIVIVPRKKLALSSYLRCWFWLGIGIDAM